MGLIAAAPPPRSLWRGARRREDRKRHEEALAQARAQAEERLREAEEEARREREAMRRAHDKQVRFPPAALAAPPSCGACGATRPTLGGLLRRCCSSPAARAHVCAQLESLREEQGSEQEGWRAAVAERARRELAEREAALVERLTRERDQQIKVRGCGEASKSRCAGLVARRCA